MPFAMIYRSFVSGNIKRFCQFQPTIEDLKEALAECKTNLDGSEGFLRSPTPTGEMCEVVKVTFSGTIASCKASVDVVKSVYNKLQAQDPGIFHKSNYKNLSSSVEGNFHPIISQMVPIASFMSSTVNSGFNDLMAMLRLGRPKIPPFYRVGDAYYEVEL